jgi:hypothetical protein
MCAATTSCPLKSARVGQVIPLIRGAPGFESMARSDADDGWDRVNQLQQADRAVASTADVECPSRERVDVVVRQLAGETV